MTIGELKKIIRWLEGLELLHKDNIEVIIRVDDWPIRPNPKAHYSRLYSPLVEEYPEQYLIADWPGEPFKYLCLKTRAKSDEWPID